MSTRNALGFCSALAWIALSTWTLAACTSAGKCERGTLDCACTSDDTCNAGLTCDDDRDVCVQNTAAGSGGTGGSGGSSGTGGSSGSGGSGGRISPTPQEPGEPPDVACDSDNFEELCTAFCEAICQNQQRFCLDSRCESGDCDPGGSLLTTCLDECGGSTTCARSLCTDQTSASLTCDTFGFETNTNFETLCLEADPACVVNPELGCAETCGTNEGVGAELADNGVCEDGRDDAENRCPRGTDCSDCGASPCAENGEGCTDHGSCCEYLRSQGALCVNTGVPTCLRVCSDEDPCPDGERCVPTDSRGAKSVCVP